MNSDEDGRERSINDANNVEIVAANWFGRQHFWPWSEDDQREFDKWLNASLAHQVAYWRLVATWKRTERLDAVKFGKPLRQRSLGNERRQGFRFTLAVAVALIVMSLVAAGRSTFRSEDQVFATGLGERRTLNLADGSQIDLNTNTVLRIQKGGRARRAILEQGEAYFQIHHDAAHPFTVTAGAQRITDLGTKFLVRDDGAALRVMLFEGKARLDTQRHGREQKSTLLEPGDLAISTTTSLKLIRHGIQSAIDALAWRYGLIVLGNHSTLADAVAEFNRYNKTKLVIEDPSVASMPIAGRFQTNGVTRFADVVTHVFGLHVREQQGAVIIER